MCCQHLVECVLSGVGSDEGDVVCGMPVSGGGFEGEGEGEERVYLGNDVTALGDGKGACLDKVKGGLYGEYGWTEVVLHVYDEESGFGVVEWRHG